MTNTAIPNHDPGWRVAVWMRSDEPPKVVRLVGWQRDLSSEDDWEPLVSLGGTAWALTPGVDAFDVFHIEDMPPGREYPDDDGGDTP